MTWEIERDEQGLPMRMWWNPAPLEKCDHGYVGGRYCPHCWKPPPLPDSATGASE